MYDTTLFQSDENLYILFASQAPSCSSWWHLRPRWALLKLNNNWYDLLINVWSKYVHDVHVFHGMMMYIVQVLGWNDRLFWCLVLIWKKNQNIELPFWFSTSVVMLILVFGPLSGMKVEDSSLDGELKKKCYKTTISILKLF